ncbi:MAG: ABC transporter substrate-binding protein [Planctomycetes bacterium]|nr:ABC transporter substrate-binding protein [Planctomycetota bacterium]
MRSHTDKLHFLLLLLAFLAALALVLLQLSHRDAKANLAGTKPLPLKYASNFSVHEAEGVKILTVHNPWPGSSADYPYVLAREGQAVPEALKDLPLIRVPLKRVITMSTTDLGFLKVLGGLDALVGISSLDLVNTPEVRERIESGRIAEVGYDQNLDLEKVVALAPEAVLAYAIGTSSEESHVKLRRAGIQVVLNASHLESSPLGRCEWIKFVALLLGREKEADKLFAEITARYRKAAELCSQVPYRPTVFLGAPFKGTWYMAGGKSFMAQLLADAGGRYLWEEDPGSTVQPLDFEAVYAKAAMGDFWLNPSDWKSLGEGKAQDERFALFRAFGEKKVYNNNLRLNGSGGNDCWESGIVAPDLLLMDLVAILHPERVPDHALYFFRHLQ